MMCCMALLLSRQKYILSFAQNLDGIMLTKVGQANREFSTCIITLVVSSSPDIFGSHVVYLARSICTCSTSTDVLVPLLKAHYIHFPLLCSVY